MYLNIDNKYDSQPSILYNSMDRNEKVCNLVLLTNDETQHFILVNDFSRLLRKGDDKNGQRLYCTQCLDGSFLTEETLKNHQDSCFKNEPCTIVLPKKNGQQGLNKYGKKKARQDILTFKNEGNKFKHPFYCCMDFEATLKPVTKDDEVNKKSDSTSKYQEHIPNSCGLKYNCIHDEYSEPIKIFNNVDENDLLKATFEELERLAKKSYELVQQNKNTIYWKGVDRTIHNECVNCPTCNVSFLYHKKVAHHDHISGEFISTLCSKCNLNFVNKSCIHS
jgi:hypothetical protein